MSFTHILSFFAQSHYHTCNLGVFCVETHTIQDDSQLVCFHGPTQQRNTAPLYDVCGNIKSIWMLYTEVFTDLVLRLL